MKQIITLFLILTCGFCLAETQSPLVVFFAKSDSVQCKQIAVFRSATSTEPFAVIHDDNVCEHWSEVELLKAKKNRYYVKISNPSVIDSLYGWVERTSCAVYLWINPAHPYRYFKFYRKADDKDPEDLIYEQDIDLHQVLVLDFDVENVRIYTKVQLKTGEILSGWTSDYCTSIYGCEGR